MEHSAIIAASAANPEFSVARDAILPALELIARQVIEKRGAYPILSNVHIVACPIGSIELRATDLDIELVATIPAQVDNPGAFTVSALLLRDLVKKAAKDADVRIVAGDGRAIVTSGRVKQSLATLPAGDYPQLQAMGNATLSAEFDAGQLTTDWQRLAPCISQEETRYYLNGIFAHIAGDELCMVATDGHRLARIARPIGEAVSDNFAGAIIPHKAVKIALAILKGEEAARVALDVSASRFRMDCGTIILQGKLIDGTFPDYGRVIPSLSSLAPVLSVESKEMLVHCDAAKGQDGKTKALAVEIDGGSIMAGIMGESGYARPLSAEYNGDACGFAFNAPYMTEFAKQFDYLELQSATFEGCTSGAPPILIRVPYAPEFTGVLMPVRKTDLLPIPQAVTYRETLPAPGQAGDLFWVEPSNVELAGSVVKSKPRKATQNECTAYLVDYAARCGLPDLGNVRLISGGDIPHGLTIGEIEQERTEYPETWSPRHGRTKDFSKPQHIEARYADGAYSIPMPGRNQAPVTVEFMGDDGEYSAPALCTDAKGNIALPDAPKERKAPKARKAKAKAAPIAESAPGEPVSAEFEPSYKALPNGEYQTSDEKGNIWLHRRDGSTVLIHDESGDAMDKAKAHAKMMQEAAAAFDAEFMPDMTAKGDLHNRMQAIADDCNQRTAASLVDQAITSGRMVIVDYRSNASPEPQESDCDIEAIQEPLEPEIVSSDVPAAPDDALPDGDTPSDAMESQPADDIGALLARLDRLESAVEAMQAAPVVEISGDTPISEKPKRSPAHVRAIMAYLAMRGERKEREQWRAMAEKSAVDYLTMEKDRNDWQAIAEQNAAYVDRERRKKREYRDMANGALLELHQAKAKRRRAILKARDFQQRLYAEHRIVDKLHERKRKAVAERDEAREALAPAKHELAELKRRIADPDNPWRETDIATIRDQAASYQQRAERAEAECERLKRLAIQHGGHIEALASRIARAETLLREKGLNAPPPVLNAPETVAA